MLMKKIVIRFVKRLMTEKTNMISHVFESYKMKSFADLGGVWGVDGGYTFYTLKKFNIEEAFLVDTKISDRVMNKKKNFHQLNLINDNFGSSDVARQIGQVDVIFLFDVLLHQVSPDWDEIVKIYANNTKCFIVYNQQFKGEKTVRLLDLGQEEYFKNVPHKKEEEPYKWLFEKMYQIHPQHKRIYRDIHNVWQWGITDNDLIGVMKSNGFQMVYFKNEGQWGKLKNFEGHAFIFKK